MRLNFSRLISRLVLTVSTTVNCFAVAQSSDHNASVVGDRLILELDRAVFSQRNLEAYVLVKHGVFTNGTVRVISAVNWQQVKDEFLNDMIVDREANRLGSFRVNPQVMQRAVEALDKAQAGSPDLKSAISGLAMSHQQVQQQIGSALRIEAYKRGKMPDRNSDLSVMTYVENDLLVKQAWFEKLRRSLMFRWFVGTEKFQAVAFRG